MSNIYEKDALADEINTVDSTDEIEEKKEIEIVSEEMAEDGNSAIVTYKQHYGDGSVKEDTQKMIKVDGKWLMDIGK